MKILYATSQDMRREGGGRTHFMEVARELSDLGNEILILLPGYMPRERRKLELSNRYVPTFKKNMISYLFYELLSALFMTYYILMFRPRVVYARQCLLDCMHVVVAWIFNIPYIMEKNGIMEDELRDRGIAEVIIKALRLSERVNFSLSSAIVCVSEGIKEVISKRYGVSNDKMVVIPNGVNTSRFRPMDKRQCLEQIGLNDGTFNVGFVGTFAAWQGIDVLVKAAREIRKHYNDVTFLLVGDGEMMGALKQLTARWSLQDEVLFFGKIPHAEIPFYINACDILVVPRGSSHLASPVKFYEYLSCARPVIVSRRSGLEEVIQEGNCGYICEPDDPVDLAAKIRVAYEEKALLHEKGVNGRKYVEKNYTWRQVSQRVFEVLSKACN